MAIDPACFSAAKAAAEGQLTDSEVKKAFDAIAAERVRLAAQGAPDQTAKLRDFAARQAERTRIAAAMQRRHASLNIIARDKVDAQIRSMVAEGLTPRQALRAIFEGTPKGVKEGRNSVYAALGANEARYLGGLMSELQRDRPHLVHTLSDPRMDADITIEMQELREGGNPGRTGNADALYAAKKFAAYAELARTDLNRLGASIGKLDGWSGAQVHDDIKMIAAGKAAWVRDIKPKLDMTRTFPEAENDAEVNEILGGVYDTIITGMPNVPTPREMGQRVNPANLAKSLGKSRVLHFKDAEASLAYREQYGYGNTFSGITAHLRNAARMGAVMEKLGPNPEVMFNSLIAAEARRISDDPNLSDKQRAKLSKGLKLEGSLRHVLDIGTGMVSRPEGNATYAKLGADIRAWQSMAKLGGSVISSISDTTSAGIASQFRGSGFFKGFLAQLGAIRARPKGERAEISYLIGEGFDGILGHIVAPAAAIDGPVGRMARWQEKFFRWNGQSWWTDAQRAAAGRMISAEMGMRAKAGYASLPRKYRHVLSMHGIDAARWEAIRQADFRADNGNTYVTPDRIRDLDDEVIEPLVADRIAVARAALKVDEAKTAETRAKREAKFEERRAKLIEDGRRDLEMSVLRFFADETSYGVIETDARSRRTATLGQRPGTAAGEGIRFFMQFKGFPTAFMQRVWGRAIFGHGKDASAMDYFAHIGTLLAGMTMAGYAAMTMKDIARGYWPPRDPTDPGTWGAAFVQGGAAGVYGDFLFGQVNRFGGGLTETAIGPGLGAIADLGELLLKAKNATLSEDEEVKMADWFNYALTNTPFVNLFYARPVMDFMFINSMREAASPGFLRRQEKRRREQYGQKTMEFLGDRQAF